MVSALMMTSPEEPLVIPQSRAQEIRDMIASAWSDITEQNGTEPTLYDHEHEGQPEGHWSIAWEGGPEEWAIMVADRWTPPEGVGWEADTSFRLNLYPTTGN